MRCGIDHSAAQPAEAAGEAHGDRPHAGLSDRRLRVFKLFGGYFLVAISPSEPFRQECTSLALQVDCYS